MFTCSKCGIICASRSTLLLHASLCESNDQNADNYSPSPESENCYSSSENLLELSPVTEEQARVAAEVEGVVEDIPGNIFVIAIQDGVTYPQATGNNTSPQTPSNSLVVAEQAFGTPTPSDELRNSVSPNNISSPQTPSNRFVVADQTFGTPTPSDELKNPILPSNISSPQVITPVRTIGGQWALSKTPKGVHQVVHWEQNEPEENQDTTSAEEPMRRAKKRLWKGTTDTPQTETNQPTQPLHQQSTPAICPYCGLKKNNSKNFTRHLKTHHAGEDSVKVLLKLSKSRSSRREIQKITECLRKLGRHKYMEKYGSDMSLPSRRGKKQNTVLVTCQFCLGVYSSDSFRHHWRSCSQRPASHLEAGKPFSESSNEKKAPESSRQFCSVLPSSSLKHDDQLITAQNIILKTMHMTDVGKQALHDTLIVKFAAERLPGVKNDAGKLDYFRQGVRDLSKLLSTIKELDPTVTNLTDCYDCSKFPVIMKAVHAISETDFVAGTVKKTSFNNRLRTPLGSCCKILLSEARINLKGTQREERVSELKHFMDELETKWPKQFGTLAENQMKENRHGKVINCADPNDISLVFNRCEEELPNAIELLKKQPNCKNYDQLMKIVALSMFTTSRRRSCDLQKLTTSDFLALEKNQELCAKVGQNLQLSDELQNRISSLYCIFSCGKDQLPTAILLTENMRSGVECILDTQRKFDIQSKRIFVRLEKQHRPWKVDLALEWAKKVFPLKDPQNFGIRGIRHLTGTVGQLLTEKDPQIESIFREGLSHSEHISKRYYRGNLASRLIQGYGLPLIEDMKSKSKSNPCCTVTSSQIGGDQGNANELITAQNMKSTSESNPSCTVTSSQVGDNQVNANELITAQNMKSKSKSNPSFTVTSSQVGGDQGNDNELIAAQFDSPLIMGSNKNSIIASPVSDEYIPDTSEEEDWQLEQSSVESPKLMLIEDKIRVVRRKWSNEEDCAIIRQFAKIIKMEKRVSGEEIRLAQENEPSLRDRTAAQIRARLSLIRLKSCSTGSKLSKLIYKLKSPEAKTYGKCGTKKSK